MAAQRGKDILLKLADATDAFVTVAGLRTRRFSLNVETVDVTHAESAGRWRELLDGAGVRRASISGSGIFKDGASDELVRQVFFDGAIRNWKIVLPDFGEITGPFQITSLDYRGEHAAEMTFEMAMESAGALAFAAL
ncbi:MAG: phage major tail protein, TP901-1 family [Methylobacterium sp.]|nr:MAG: phage major tail protein, TP901-1 family [Methylobacterium sp.]